MKIKMVRSFWSSKNAKKKKDMNWVQAQANYPKLSPFSDADRDGVKNWLDCKPFDKRRQDIEFDEEGPRRPEWAKGWSERDMEAHLMSTGLSEKDAEEAVKKIVEKEED